MEQIKLGDELVVFEDLIMEAEKSTDDFIKFSAWVNGSHNVRNPIDHSILNVYNSIYQSCLKRSKK